MSRPVHRLGRSPPFNVGTKVKQPGHACFSPAPPPPSAAWLRACSCIAARRAGGAGADRFRSRTDAAAAGGGLVGRAPTGVCRGVATRRFGGAGGAVSGAFAAVGGGLAGAAGGGGVCRGVGRGGGHGTRRCRGDIARYRGPRPPRAAQLSRAADGRDAPVRYAVAAEAGRAKRPRGRRYVRGRCGGFRSGAGGAGRKRGAERRGAGLVANGFAAEAGSATS